MKRYTKEQIYAANGVDIVALLESRGEKLKRKGRDYCWAGDNSVAIRGNVWYDHNGSGEHGLAVDFVKKYMGLDFREAVKFLLNGEDGLEFKGADKPKREFKPFELPPRDYNMRRVFKYLCETRGISHDVVDYFAHQHTIYQSWPYGNVVFVGNDEDGTPRYAHTKSTNQDSEIRFDIAGSDKQYSFNHRGESMFLYVFEAPIDMLSYISLHPDNWHENSYIALGGLAFKPLLHFLEKHKGFSSICLCYDNDKAGVTAAHEHQKKLIKKGYGVALDLPVITKDWNEELLRRREQEQEQTAESQLMGFC